MSFNTSSASRIGEKTQHFPAQRSRQDPEKVTDEIVHGEPKKDTAEQNLEKAFCTSFREARKQKRSRYQKWNDYIKRPKNWISSVTLAAVVVYTAIQGLQLCVIRDQESRQLRAYVSAEPTGGQILVKPLPLLGNVTIYNTGVTPADNIRSTSLAILVDAGETVPPAHWMLHAKEVDYGSLFPQRSRTPVIQEKQATTQPDIDDFNAGRKNILIFGIVSYDDIFGGSSKSTEFCWIYSRANAESYGAVFCPNNNDAD